ncbi:phage tail sheath subtilisin-like domain-containing protein [Zooshikella marina]|uniref:phage tail sheath family protein n=1 Tax=Zooshikella ganghwensis TaxID=202772 RepID=UPI001BAF13B7|nr:phage tail sheath C-terminal domain-containing protein [Zooshikella ganghwensis]MBU2707540.1 phage tail sheath subtilisin-like domain-containing protein [Zooshikella ganghwensis]
MAFLHGVEVLELDGGPRPISTVKSSVIGLVGAAAKGPINKPVLIAGSRKEAVKIFGKPTGDNTIPDFLDAIFDQAGAMVVVVNAFDRSKVNSDTMRKSAAAMPYQFKKVEYKLSDFTFNGDSLDLGYKHLSNIVVKSVDEKITYVEGKAYEITSTTPATENSPASGNTILKLKDGNGSLMSNAQVKVSFVRYEVELDHDYVSDVVLKKIDGSKVYTDNTDYDVDEDKGVVIQVPSQGIKKEDKVLISYKYPDPTKAESNDIRGKGSDTGIQALLGAESTVYATPRILLAPGFTGKLSADKQGFHSDDVSSDLVSIADRLRAIVVADGPSTNDEDAKAYAALQGSARLYLVDPNVKVPGAANDEALIQPSSPRVAGIIAKSDNERGFWWSPSNRPVYGILGTDRAIDFTLGDSNARANLLNENNVATIIRQNGFRLWGNRSCSLDPKWKYISVRRTADLINDSLLRAHLWAVDRNITRNYVESVVESVNRYLRSLKAMGAIIDGKCWADPELNTPDQIMDGKVYFDFDFTPPYPAEHISFRSQMVDNYLKEVFA